MDKRTDLMIRHSKINNEFFGRGTVEYTRAAYDIVWVRLTGEETIMEQYEVESKSPGRRNWVVPIPGTDGMSVSLGVHERAPARWNYSVWRNGRALIDAGIIDFPGLMITAEQVARVVFLLTVDYANATREAPAKIEPRETSF